MASAEILIAFAKILVLGLESLLIILAFYLAKNGKGMKLFFFLPNFLCKFTSFYYTIGYTLLVFIALCSSVCLE